MATQEDRSAKRIFEEVLQFYEKYYGVTYEVVNLDTYIIYLDGDEEIGRLYHIDNYGLGFNLSALLNIINEKVLSYERFKETVDKTLTNYYNKINYGKKVD